MVPYATSITSPCWTDSQINRHLRIGKSTKTIIPGVLYYVGSIDLEEDDEMCSATGVGQGCEAEMSAWYSFNIWNCPLVAAVGA